MFFGFTRSHAGVFGGKFEYRFVALSLRQPSTTRRRPDNAGRAIAVPASSPWRRALSRRDTFLTLCVHRYLFEIAQQFILSILDSSPSEPLLTNSPTIGLFAPKRINLRKQRQQWREATIGPSIMSTSVPTRRNGFTPPYSKAQISAWVAMAVSIMQFPLVVSPIMPLQASIPVTLVFFATVVGTIYYGILALAADPMDVHLEQHLQTSSEPNDARDKETPWRTKLYNACNNNTTTELLVVPDEPMKQCWICDIQVAEHSMHCKFCNKCVYHFDHHCMCTSYFISCVVLHCRPSCAATVTCLSHAVHFFQPSITTTVQTKQGLIHALAKPTIRSFSEPCYSSLAWSFATFALSSVC